MDYLQYIDGKEQIKQPKPSSFKPCYKWITFNTFLTSFLVTLGCLVVLNLVINGLPSIHW